MWFVYRCYGVANRLLYVGVTSNPRRRMSEHKRSSRWYRLVIETKYEAFADRDEALDREDFLIYNKSPSFNERGGVPGKPNRRPGKDHREIIGWRGTDNYKPAPNGLPDTWYMSHDEARTLWYDRLHGRA